MLLNGAPPATYKWTPAGMVLDPNGTVDLFITAEDAQKMFSHLCRLIDSLVEDSVKAHRILQTNNRPISLSERAQQVMDGRR